MAETVCMAQAFEQCERKRVDAYIRPIFDSFQFEYSGDLAQKCGLSGPVRDPEDLYLVEQDVKLKDYYNECDAEHREHGFTGPQGHCPALRAEYLRREAEAALLVSLGEFLGEPFDETYGDMRKKAIDLALSACLGDHRKAA